jgi:hypothetical protein
MARMTREFSLVLLGAGVLTAGYFMWPEEDLNARAEEKAGEQVASSSATGTSRTYRGGFIFIPMGSFGRGSGPMPAGKAAGFTSGGFGARGAAVSVGG